MSKKSKKKAQISKLNQSEDEEVQDLIAWGRKKQNYYRDDQQQYSSLSEQQKQAKKIYDNQYDNYMNDQELYDIPVNNKKEMLANKQGQNQQFLINDDISQQEQQQSLPLQYVQQQLEWIFQLFIGLQHYSQTELLPIYENLLKSYLLSIISIKQLKIPYIQYHPIIKIAVEIKMKIVKLMKKLEIKEEDSQNEGESDENVDQYDDQDQEDQFDGLDLQNYPGKSCNNAIKEQSSQHKKGLQYYNQIKKMQQQQKKLKKYKKTIKIIIQKTCIQINQVKLKQICIRTNFKKQGTYQKKKKIQGNSRVKLRKKFEKKKAIHRAKTGHFIRENPGRAYQGQSNIKTGKIAGVKLK